LEVGAKLHFSKSQKFETYNKIPVIPIQHASGANPKFNQMLENKRLIDKENIRKLIFLLCSLLRKVMDACNLSLRSHLTPIKTESLADPSRT
jgi:hypothetical protein